MQRDTRSQKFPLGSKLPAFKLPNVDGREIESTQYFKSTKAALIAFTCNHCPYVKGSENLLIDIVRTFESKGLRAITISSNDAVQYPEDSFEKMAEKAKELALPYPYLYDQSQEVARLFDAACTPECFLFDQNQMLVYQGAITDRPKEKDAQRKDLLSPAIEMVLSGKKPSVEFNHPIGCSIKWKL